MIAPGTLEYHELTGHCVRVRRGGDRPCCTPRAHGAQGGVPSPRADVARGRGVPSPGADVTLERGAPPARLQLSTLPHRSTCAHRPLPRLRGRAMLIRAVQCGAALRQPVRAAAGYHSRRFHSATAGLCVGSAKAAVQLLALIDRKADEGGILQVRKAALHSTDSRTISVARRRCKARR